MIQDSTLFLTRLTGQSVAHNQIILTEIIYWYYTIITAITKTLLYKNSSRTNFLSSNTISTFACEVQSIGRYCRN